MFYGRKIELDFWKWAMELLIVENSKLRIRQQYNKLNLIIQQLYLSNSHKYLHIFWYLPMNRSIYHKLSFRSLSQKRNFCRAYKLPLPYISVVFHLPASIMKSIKFIFSWISLFFVIFVGTFIILYLACIHKSFRIFASENGTERNFSTIFLNYVKKTSHSEVVIPTLPVARARYDNQRAVCNQNIYIKNDKYFVMHKWFGNKIPY